MIKIDGSMMEGGGQLLRMSTSYSAILGEPLTVYNIRAGRSPPGLKPQHLTTLKAAAQISGADLQGGKINSKEIQFSPSKIKGGKYLFDIGTAGSITLLLQCLIPISTYADKNVKMTVLGGTAVKWSPPTTFLSNVILSAFREIGLECSLSVRRHGFYPKGGGKVSVEVKRNDQLNYFKPRNGKIKIIHGISLCGNLPSHVAKRQAKSASKQLLQKDFNPKIDVKTLTGSSRPYSPGSLICLWTDNRYIGADSLGEKGKPAERVGKEAANKLITQIQTGAEVDHHTCDHLILPCSLATGTSRFKTSNLTLHILTAIEIAKIFTEAKFSIKGKQGKPAEITCTGIGFNK